MNKVTATNLVALLSEKPASLERAQAIRAEAQKQLSAVGPALKSPSVINSINLLLAIEPKTLDQARCSLESARELLTALSDLQVKAMIQSVPTTAPVAPAATAPATPPPPAAAPSQVAAAPTPIPRLLSREAYALRAYNEYIAMPPTMARFEFAARNVGLIMHGKRISDSMNQPSTRA